MKRLTQTQFDELTIATRIKPRLRRELRFATSTENMSDTDWQETEMLAVYDRSRANGVLIIEPNDNTYVLPFTIKKIANSVTTGRAQPIICDFCRTWQAGTRAASISFVGMKRGLANIGYLCCADLQCSAHVRTKTDAAKMSRAQIRENLDNDGRVERLRARLQGIMTYLEVTPAVL